MRTRMYGGVGGRKTKVGGNLLLFSSYPIIMNSPFDIICAVPIVAGYTPGKLLKEVAPPVCVITSTFPYYSLR